MDVRTVKLGAAGQVLILTAVGLGLGHSLATSVLFGLTTAALWVAWVSRKLGSDDVLGPAD